MSNETNSKFFRLANSPSENYNFENDYMIESCPTINYTHPMTFTFFRFDLERDNFMWKKDCYIILDKKKKERYYWLQDNRKGI